MKMKKLQCLIIFTMLIGGQTAIAAKPDRSCGWWNSLKYMSSTLKYTVGGRNLRRTYWVVGATGTLVTAGALGYAVAPGLGIWSLFTGGVMTKCLEPCVVGNQSGLDEDDFVMVRRDNDEDVEENCVEVRLPLTADELARTGPYAQQHVPSIKDYYYREDLTIERKKELLDGYIKDNKCIEYSLENQQFDDDADQLRQKLIVFIFKHYADKNLEELRTIAERLANYLPGEWIKKAGLIFIGKEAAEKREILAGALKKSSLYKKVVTRKDLDLDDTTQRIVDFVIDELPEARFDDAKKAAMKIAAIAEQDNYAWSAKLGIC
jgi:hypothetical protein